MHSKPARSSRRRASGLAGPTVTANLLVVNAGALDGMKASDVNDNLRQRLQIPTDIKGAVVTNVDENSIAANSGLQQNDVILEINRHAVAGANDVTNLVKQAAGPRVLFKLWRSENGSAGTVFLSVDNAKRNN